MRITDQPPQHFASTIGDTATIFGLVSGIIGETIVILPLLGIKAGYITSILISSLIGFISYYTARLYVVHLGKQQDIRQAILVHFSYDTKYVKLYSFLIFVSFVATFFEYFRLICIQLQGLTGSDSGWLSFTTMVLLIIFIIIIRIFHIGQQTIAFGVLTIFLYSVFIVWVLLSAPTGSQQIPPFGEPFTLSASLVLAYSCHSFITQNIVKNPDRSSYPKIVAAAYILSVIVYNFFSLGSFGLVNRIPYKAHPETIYDYFQVGEWQVSILQIIHLVHFTSAFPNFMIVSKVEFFNLFDIKIENEVRLHEYIYIVVLVFLSYFVYAMGVSLVTLIIIDGSVICFTYVIAFPIWLHFKCLFYDRSCGFIEGDEENNRAILINRCQCDNNYRWKWSLWVETAFLSLVVIYGLVFLVTGLKSIGSNKNGK